MDYNTNSDQCLYFAYGSNMDEKQMKEREVFFHSKYRAALSDYQFVFNKPSTIDQSGKANIILKNGSTVYGIAYEIDTNDLNVLKAFEAGYIIECFNVILLDQKRKVWCKAFTYKKNRIAMKPTAEYYNKIITALTDNDFPSEYILEIENLMEMA